MIIKKLNFNLIALNAAEGKIREKDNFGTDIHVIPCYTYP